MEFIKKNKKILITIMIIILILFIIFLLMVNGYIIPTKIEAEKFEVKGVDVSEYQGEVDWDKIKEQNIDFAFIKATEGSKGKDDYFDKNYEKLKNMDMLLGLYHFFSFDSDAISQSENIYSFHRRVDDLLLKRAFDHVAPPHTRKEARANPHSLTVTTSIAGQS